MTSSGLEKSDLGKNRFYTVLNVPYPTGKIIAAQRIQAVYWLVIGQSHCSCHQIRQRRYAIARGDMPERQYKVIADWLSGLTVVCA